jgi:hypothetical protein
VRSSNTWYYLYLIGKSTDGTVAGLWSTVNESQSGAIVLPSGYDQKAQTRTAWSTDNVSNLRYARVAEGWPFRPLMMYNDATSQFNTTTPLTVLASGTATSFTAISCANLIPPVSAYGYFNMGMINNGNSVGGANFRTTGFTSNGVALLGTSGNVSGQILDRYVGLYEVDSLQRIDYKRNGGSLAGVNVMGYLITEIN